MPEAVKGERWVRWGIKKLRMETKKQFKRGENEKLIGE